MNSFSLKTGLAMIGLTEQSVVSAGMAMITRRIAVEQYDTPNPWISYTDEMRKFLTDSNYRKLMVKVGKDLRRDTFGKENLIPRVMGLLSESSVTMENLSDQFEFSNGEIVINDDVVNAFTGELFGLLKTHVGPVLGVGSTPKPTTTVPGEAEFLGSALKAAIGSTPVEQLFPDVHSYLTLKEA